MQVSDSNIVVQPTLLGIVAIFCLSVEPAPAPGALILSAAIRGRADDAAKTGIPLTVERMNRHLVSRDELHQCLLAPIHQRIQLENSTSGSVFIDQGRLFCRLLAILGLIPALTRNPAIGGLEQLPMWPDLAHLAAIFLFLL